MTLRRHKFLRGLAVVAILAGMAVAALPWWLPFAVRAVGRSYGVEVGEWERDGWRTIVYRDVTYSTDGLRAHVDELRLPLLGLWPVSNDGPALLISGAVLAFSPSPQPTPESPGAPSVPAIMRSVLGAWPQIERWLPATLIDGLVIETGGTPVQIQSVSWGGGELHAAGAIPGRTETVNVALSREGETGLRLRAEAASFAARGDVLIQWTDANADVSGDVFWRQNQAAVSARFGAAGLMPTTAAFDAPAVSVPSSDLNLTGYGPVQGSISLDWTGTTYVVAVLAQAEPNADSRTSPPLSVDVRATGDLNTVRAETALVRLPGIEANLSSPLAVDLQTGLPQSAAAFSIAIDLEAMPWQVGAGHLAGRADVTAGEIGAPPLVAFELAGNDIGWRDVSLTSLALAGRWSGDQLDLDRVILTASDDSTLSASASLGLREQTIGSATVQADIAASVLRPWASGLPEFDRLTFEAAASGAFSAPEHAGSLSVAGLQVGPDVSVDVETGWEAVGVTSATGQGELTTDPGIRVPLRFAVARHDDGSMTITCNELSWNDGSGEWWRLSNPATFTVFTATANPAPRIVIDSLQMRGERVALDVAGEIQWPAFGRVELHSDGFDPARLAPLVSQAGLGVRIDALNLVASWDHGPVAVDGDVRATYAPTEQAAYAVEAQFATRDAGRAAATLRILDASGVVLEGGGELPLQLAGDADGFQATVPRDGAVSLALDSAPNPVFWESLAQLTGWQIEDPSVTLNVSGSLAQPRGTLEFQTARVHPPANLAAGQLPAATDLHLVATADDDGLALTNGSVAIEGRWLTWSGRMPWSAWDVWREEHRIAWRRAEFSLASEPLPMTIVARALPTVLAPDGQMSFEMKHAPDRGFTGRLWLHQAATRPIPPLQTIRDIEGEITLEAYDLRLNRLIAYVGGRSIEITGAANIQQRNVPVFDLHLASARVPLVRDQGVVLRASLDLDLVQTAEQPAHISGTATLGSSVFVSDLASLLPTGGVSAPEQRPPYFSVREAPFADWTLDVAVRGDNFLRIENPFFRGTLSADFQLDGTLAEPRAIGRVWSNAGSVIFPFGNVPIEQLEVTLSPENPYEPQLFVVGATRLYGYDLRMEATGSASEPRLTFSSDPPTSSQQVFLLLTTGQMPDEGRAFTTEERARRLALFVGRALARDFGLGGEGQEQLIIRSGEDFSREGGETYYVQYNLDGTWSLIGEYDRFDAYNGGIKYRLIDR